jgi:SET domain-containing protein
MSNLAKKIIDSSRIKVKNSPIHGRGVFAETKLKKGECLIEYKGERISWKEAIRRHPHDPLQPNHTFYFSLENGNVIDAKNKGNAARWINHSCKPNCEAIEIDDAKLGSRVFLVAKKNIKPKEELFYDYSLSIDGKITKSIKKDYECRCGNKKCRGTMLQLD